MVHADGIPDLAPSIYRQRMVLEGTRSAPFGSSEIVRYLDALSNQCGMSTLITPVTHRSERYGWAGWVHWEASGAHFYAWDRPVFFSVDIYTCAPFDPDTVAHFTSGYLGADLLVARAY